MSDVLERNLERLFARAWRPPRPSAAFRARLHDAFEARAARFARPRRTLAPLWLAAAAALVVVGLAWRMLGGTAPERPLDLQTIVARGEVAWRAGAGPWNALRAEDGTAQLGARAAPLEVRTPSDVFASVAWAGGELVLEANGALELRAEPQGESAWLARGALSARSVDAALQLAARDGGLALAAGSARLEVTGEGLAIGLDAGRGRISDLPQAREVEAPGRWLVRGGRVLEPAEPSVGRREALPGVDPAPEEPAAAAPPPACLRGRVRAPDGFDEDGTPRWRAVESFTVFALRAVALPMAVMPEIVRVEDAEGRFALPALEEGDYVVFVLAPGFAAWRSEAMPLGEALEDAALVPTLDVRLELGVTLSGVVRDATSGAPLSGAVVVSERDAPIGVLALDRESLEEFGFLRLAVTDADGGWVLEHVARGTQVLRASGGGASVAWLDGVDVRGTQPITDLDFALPPAGTIEGRVLDAEGRARSGAVVLASATDFSRQRPTLSYAACEVDAEGRYAIPGLPGGLVAVLLFADGLARQQGSPDMRMVALRAPGRATADFLEKRTVARLRGRLVDGNGAALAGRTLWLQQASGPDSGRAFVSARTDDAGGFRFEELTPGAHELYVGGLRPTEMTLVDDFRVAAGEELEREFRVGDERVTGVVRAADDGAPVSGALVVLLAGAEQRFVAKAMCEPDGSFALEHVRAGMYELAVAPLRGRLGGLSRPGLAVAAGVGVAGLELELPRGAALVVRVVDELGAPVSGAVLALRRADGGELYCDDVPQTDAEGRWEHEALDAGAWIVRARHPDFRDGQGRVELAVGARGELLLTLERAP